jgi:beta-N-acetylhexosaminidase
MNRDVGSLLVGGFSGLQVSASFRAACKRGERGGAILFQRNIDAPKQIAELTGELGALLGETIVAVDQEGGRVARLAAPCLRVPPLLAFANSAPAALYALGLAQGRELRALGFTLNFSPVLDVHSEPLNPIIGDRALGISADAAAVRACALAEGLRDAGITACGKHFPGHGATTTDSHLTLPRVRKSVVEMAVELGPFQQAIEAGIPSLMSAHVVYDAFRDRDGVERAATLSPAIMTHLLREQLHFDGVLFSDDLEMSAITLGAGEAAILALAAGCDALLICSDESKQDEAFAALTRECEASPVFRDRVAEASARVRGICRVPTPDLETLERLVREHQPYAAELLHLAQTFRSQQAEQAAARNRTTS